MSERNFAFHEILLSGDGMESSNLIGPIIGGILGGLFVLLLLLLLIVMGVVIVVITVGRQKSEAKTTSNGTAVWSINELSIINTQNTYSLH